MGCVLEQHAQVTGCRTPSAHVTMPHEWAMQSMLHSLDARGSLPRSPKAISNNKTARAAIDASAPPPKQPMFPNDCVTVQSVNRPASELDAARMHPKIKSVKLQAVPETLPMPARATLLKRHLAAETLIKLGAIRGMCMLASQRTFPSRETYREHLYEACSSTA
jgi:hypothetical protein